MEARRILNATKVAFSGATGDDRSPESLPFPACMATLMECMGEKYPVETIRAHGRAYTTRVANREFLTASGMAFGFLFDKELCMSCMDVSQIAPHNETISRAYRWAGYECHIVEGADAPSLRARVIDSIAKGAPVLAFGLFDVPECAIIAGYDQSGEVLIGWSHFQTGETEPSGMFRRRDWEKEIWKMVFTGERTGRTLSVREVLSYGADILAKTEVEGYLAGDAAYEAWIKLVLSARGEENIYKFHRSLLFNLAELRCWGGNFLDSVGQARAGECFAAIHDLCWKADAIVGDKGARAFESEEAREAVAGVLRDIRALDSKAEAMMRESIQ